MDFQNFNFTDIYTYFNIGIITMLGFSALFGFISGFYKKAYKLIVFAALILLGWFLSPLIVKFLMDQNLGQYLSVIDGFDGVTTIKSAIPIIAQKIMPELGYITEGTYAFQLAYEVLFMVLRLIVLIAWLILMGTVFKFVFWIVYRIIKPKKNKGNKTGFVSRTLGAGVGVVHTLLFLALLSIPFAGLTSLGAELATLIPEEDEIQETGYNPIIKRNLANDENPFADFAPMVDFMKGYKDTALGKIGSSLKIKGSGFDEYIFDEIFSFEINNHKIRIKDDLANGLKAYELLNASTGGELSLEKIQSMDKVELANLFSIIGKLNILNIAVPIGLEYFYRSSEDDIISEELYSEIIRKATQINLKVEIDNIGLLFVAATELELLKEGSSLNDFLSLDADKVKDLFTGLSERQLVTAALDLGFQYFSTTEEFSNFLAGFSLEKSDINTSGLVWKNEIANLGNIFKSLVELGITFSEDELIDLSNIGDVQINSFGDAIYGSNFLSNNSTALAKILVSFLPEEFKGVLVVNDVKKNDFVSLLTLGKVLYSSGLMEEDFDFKNLLTDDNIEKLSDNISKSNLLSSNINGLLDLILNTLELPFNLEIDPEFNWAGENGKKELKAILNTSKVLLDMGIVSGDFLTNLTSESINNLSDQMTKSNLMMSNVDNILTFVLNETDFASELEITIREINWSSETGKAEFKNILSAVAAIQESNLLNNPDLTTLSDETIDNLAVKLSASIVIRDNLTPIMEQMLNNQTSEFSLELFDNPDHWTELELSSLFKATRIIMSKENLPGDIFSLTDNELDIILNSRLISQTLVKTIEEKTASGAELDGLLITTNVQGDDWYDTYLNGVRTNDGELRKLFTNGKIIFGNNPDFNNLDINKIFKLTTGEIDESSNELDAVLDSVVLKDTIVNQIFKLDDDGLIEVRYLEQTLLPKDEIKKLFKGMKELFGEDVDLENFSFEINEVLNKTETELDTVVASIIISDTIAKKLLEFDSESNSALVISLELYDNAWPDEIKSFIGGIKVLLGEFADLDNLNIDVNTIKNLTANDPGTDDVSTLLSSIILKDTMIEKIVELDGHYGIVVNKQREDDDWNDSTVAGEHIDGEIRSLIKAMQVLDFDLNESFDIDKIRNLSTDNHESDDVSILLSSTIIKDTIIRKIVELDGQNGIVVRLNAADEGWVDTKVAEVPVDGEIRALIKAINVINFDLGTSFDVDTILNLNEADQNTLVSSIIISDTTREAIKGLAAPGGALAGTLIIPTTLSDDDYHGVDGELKRFIKSMKLVVGNSQIANATFEVDKFLNSANEDNLLGSLIIEASAINYIKQNTDGKLIIPSDEAVYYYLPNEQIVWEQIVNNLGEVIDKGELRRLLQGVRLLSNYPVGNFDSLNFDMSSFLSVNFELVLESRVLEATLADMVNDLLNGGVLDGFIKEPDGLDGNPNGYHFYHHRSSTNTVRSGQFVLFGTTKQYTDLSGLLNSMKAMNEAGLDFKEINMYTISSVDEGDLAAALFDYSRVMRGSIGTMLNKTLENANFPGKPDFSTYAFSSKAEVEAGLTAFKLYVSLN